MSASNESATHPFTDAEIEHRKRCLDLESKVRISQVLCQPALTNPVEQTSTYVDKRVDLAPRAVATRAELGVNEVVEAFERASVESASGTRLIVARPPSRHASALDTGTSRLPYTIGGWDLVSVEQRITDADFVISLTFYDPPQENPSPRMIANALRCRLCYQPQRDDCYLTNEDSTRLRVTKLASPDGPQEDSKCLDHNRSCLVSTGVWRISFIETEEQHLVEFLLLRRQFVVCPIYLPNKRSLDEAELVGGRSKSTETSKQPAPLPPVAAGKSAADGAPMNCGPSSSTETVHIDTMSVLQLSKECSLLVKSSPPTEVTLEDEGVTSYRLDFRWKIDETVGSKVFACYHSALPGGIVVKALDYTDRPSGRSPLSGCVKNWKREQALLDRLDHPNIIKLKSYDSRMLALYLEHLPLSVQRQSPVSPAVALTLLGDISAALNYLEREKIVHNDIKPANIAYSAERGGVLFDFGMAAIDGELVLGGTPMFLPPEYLSHEVYKKRRGPHSDIWALGLTMLFCTGKIRYPKKKVAAINLFNLAIEDSADTQNLKNWHATIDCVRVGLALEEQMDLIIYHMLEPKFELRITAAGILAELGRYKDVSVNSGSSLPSTLES
ncbi:uncharacterized protein UV8b_07628 [Ustilaginoidea virens]|uniref:Protein kinase domain-containing protein n=1 Tax=Ustilaginoidea virens TaxID=1159556 RepID=A0A063BQQ7_USTVR|nr:uncharacterized protein UV8b_07628 [Ustilaginoidea virens]QUC23387.1 hypothetical protein UV8b_07628 [Ustilaginoidea virens]GAO19642.1 hypothetical protein UVI_02045690 [Ustilaginoidea virens]